MPAIAIIIPHYNDAIRLERCLGALVHDDIRNAEIVVVDNGSTTPLDHLITAFPNIRFVTETRKGAAAARNRGVIETRAPLLCFLDSDCVPAPDWIDAAERAAAKGDIVGGAITVFDETPGPRSGPEAFETVFAFDYRAYIERDGFAVTANLVTHREIFEAAGPFVPGLSEDVEWCRRATRMGFNLVCDEGLRVAHPTRPDWPSLERKWHRMMREAFMLHGTDPAARSVWALRGLAMIPSIAVHTPKILLSPRLNGPAERIAALRTLARLRLKRCAWMLGQAMGPLGTDG